ncbi:hypothetical protein ACHAPO_007128 [Fusarium lateritium]
MLRYQTYKKVQGNRNQEEQLPLDGISRTPAPKRDQDCNITFSAPLDAITNPNGQQPKVQPEDESEDRPLKQKRLTGEHLDTKEATDQQYEIIYISDSE